MATSQPISTISYNSEAFLKEKLDAWVKAHIIQAYMYICHIGEDGDKNHIHLRIEPNKKLDPMDLTDELQEYQIGQKKPLGCRPWRQSVEEHWILYVVHDKEYLDWKYGGGEKGEKLPYDWQKIVVSEGYDMEIAFIRAKQMMKHTSTNMANKLQHGERALNLVLQGENVYNVNAVLRTLQTTDYERVCEELERTKDMLHSLEEAIDDMGLAVLLNEDGSIKLELAVFPKNEEPES